MKGSGLDGFLAYFFQHNWSIVGRGVCQFVRDMLLFRTSLKDINTTFITLIPKVSNARRFGEFCPISLCNILYKIVAKTLANLQKPMLSTIISPQQSAFVPGHLITNNIFIAYEVLHSLSNRVKEKQRFMALKLDMSKA